MEHSRQWERFTEASTCSLDQRGRREQLGKEFNCQVNDNDEDKSPTLLSTGKYKDLMIAINYRYLDDNPTGLVHVTLHSTYSTV